MTYPAINQSAPGRSRGLAERIRNAKRQLSDHVHSSADHDARANGWTVTHTTGRLGMGARTYHDPRFASRSLAPPAGAGAGR